MHKERKYETALVFLFQLLFWGGLVVACFANALNLPSWLPRVILIIYAIVFGLFAIGCLLYGGISLGTEWSEGLLAQHGSRPKTLLLLPGYAFLAGVGLFIFALASRYEPESNYLLLFAVLLAPGILIGILFGIIKGKQK